MRTGISLLTKSLFLGRISHKLSTYSHKTLSVAKQKLDSFRLFALSQFYCWYLNTTNFSSLSLQMRECLLGLGAVGWKEYFKNAFHEMSLLSPASSSSSPSSFPSIPPLSSTTSTRYRYFPNFTYTHTTINSQQTHVCSIFSKLFSKLWVKAFREAPTQRTKLFLFEALSAFLRPASSQFPVGFLCDESSPVSLSSVARTMRTFFRDVGSLIQDELESILNQTREEREGGMRIDQPFQDPFARSYSNQEPTDFLDHSAFPKLVSVSVLQLMMEILKIMTRCGEIPKGVVLEVFSFLFFRSLDFEILF